MIPLIAWFLLGFACLLATAVAIVFIEIVAAIALPQDKSPHGSEQRARPSLAVVVPAHDESSRMVPTLMDVQSQLLPGDRLVVVADNCSDDTAAVAMTSGAEVVERHDPTRVGKGFALHQGIQELRSNPPEVVVIVDADCRLAYGSINELAFTCDRTRRPVQALYLMSSPSNSAINHQVAEFAWRIKNWLRPLGLKALKQPCQLMGTGMAFPWDVIKSANLNTGGLVEDMVLGLALTLDKHPPIFCPAARITSQFPSSLKGTISQRKRWEQGHIETIVKTAPKLILAAIFHRNWGLLVLALDVAIPPLSLLAVMVIGSLAISGIAVFFGFQPISLDVNVDSLSLFAVAILLSWLKCGRDILGFDALSRIIPYVVRKLGLYIEFFSGKMDARWTRTDRSK